jgi:hypothetical protein
MDYRARGGNANGYGYRHSDCHPYNDTHGNTYPTPNSRAHRYADAH